jgi:hypothetical protein
MGLFDGYTPDTTPYDDDDVPVTWLNPKELADKYSPENPLVIEGVKEFARKQKSKFINPGMTEPKDEVQLVIRRGEEKFGLTMSSTMFVRECEEAEVTELPKGAPVAILYAGKSGESKNGKFHWVEVRSERSAANKEAKKKAKPTTEKIPF